PSPPLSLPPLPRPPFGRVFFLLLFFVFRPPPRGAPPPPPSSSRGLAAPPPPRLDPRQPRKSCPPERELLVSDGKACLSLLLGLRQRNWTPAPLQNVIGSKQREEKPVGQRAGSERQDVAKRGSEESYPGNPGTETGEEAEI